MDKCEEIPPRSHSDAVALGRQMTVEFYDCSADILADVQQMEKVFLDAAALSGAHVVNSNFHSVAPQGVSGVLVISESHFAVHAWPEHDYAAVDLFTCGAGVDFDLAVKALARGMNSRRWIISSLVNRGILHESGQLERLVPVVENGQSCGMHLSWQERFERSGARAISGCIDIYECRDMEVNSSEKWKAFAEEVVALLSPPETARGEWVFFPRGRDAEFFRIFGRGRIAGFISCEKSAVYLNVFTDGFFEPRQLAEFAMEKLSGTYYRMQVQIRQ